MAYVLLLVAIVLEVVASLALKMSDGFSRLGPSAVALGGFVAALALLAQVSSRLPLSLTYPTWAGLGLVGATLGAAALFGERITVQHGLGIALIVAGVALVHAPRLLAGGLA